MRITLLSLLLICYTFTLSAQASLTVSDPQIGWETERGTIEEASIVITPLGVYSDISLYMTLSAEGLLPSWVDTVEAVLDFTLPQEAAIIDSWLWIDDIIVKADILDRRVASEIYEEIVDRRQDPSILFKSGAGQYQLRVFPMATNGTRKVMIRYLMPNNWSMDKVETLLPMEILLASYYPLTEVEVLVQDQAGWDEPYIPELEDADFQYVQIVEAGNFYRTVLVLQENQILPYLSLAFPSPQEEGLFLSKNDSLGIYNMVLLPDQLLELPATEGRDIDIIFDYKAQNSIELEREDLIKGLQFELLNHLTANDRFRIWSTAYYGAPNLITSDWVSGDAETILNTFNGLNPESIFQNGDLISNLTAYLDILEELEEVNDIILVSNSQSEGDFWGASTYVNQVYNHPYFDQIRMFFINYQSYNYYQWFGNNGLPTEWVGNDLFYYELALLSSGTYFKSGPYRYKLAKALEATENIRGEVELYTTLQNGITYNRYLLGGDIINTSLHRPLYQVGKFLGDFPFEVDYSAIWEGSLFNYSTTVNASSFMEIDSIADETWAANFLSSLENSTQSDVAETIVEKSIEHRVLSIHTAFLCLEPIQGGVPCTECIDIPGGEIVVVNTKEQSQTEPEIQLSAYPNPFKEEVSILITAPDGVPKTEYQFVVYDNMGRLISVLPAVYLSAGQQHQMEWNGQTAFGQELPAGVYILMVKSVHTQAEIKLIKG